VDSGDGGFGLWTVMRGVWVVDGGEGGFGLWFGLGCRRAEKERDGVEL
jgi:hypothetical protein